MNAPAYEFLSVPLPVVTVLHLLTLTLHLAAMSAVFGGLGALLLARVPGRLELAGGRRFVRLAPTLMAATVTLGVAPLLFLQLVYHRQVYAAAIASAWYWLAVPAAVVAAYYLLYAQAFRAGAATAAGAAVATTPLVLAFLLLAFVSMVYSAVFTLAETPRTLAAAWSADPSGLVLDPDLGRWLPRWLHVVAGAVMTGAFALAAFARDDERLSGTARAICGGSFLAAVLLGFGALAGLREALPRYMSSAAILWLLASLLLALGALHFLFRGRLVPAGAALFVSLFAMVVQRHLARDLMLRGALDPAALPVRPQWDVFALFLACFVAMLAVGAWMLRAFFRASATVDAGRGDRGRAAA